MERSEYIRRGEAIFYNEVRIKPMIIKERIVAVKLHEVLSPLDNSYLRVIVYGESGTDIWYCMESWDTGILSEETFEKMRSLGEFLSAMFSIPLEIKI